MIDLEYTVHPLYREHNAPAERHGAAAEALPPAPGGYGNSQAVGQLEDSGNLFRQNRPDHHLGPGADFGILVVRIGFHQFALDYHVALANYVLQLLDDIVVDLAKHIASSNTWKSWTE